MAAYKKPIRRSLVIGCIAFIAALCVVLMFTSYLQTSKLLYKQYDQQLAHALHYVERITDADDLEECMETGVASEKYKAEQEILNNYIDPHELAYLYVVVPTREYMVNAISATSDEERANGDDDMAIGETSDAYSEEELLRYMSYWNKDNISYFEEVSDWGDCYTAVKPLKNSKGKTIALICADVFIDSVHHQIHMNMLVNLLLTIITGVLFGILLLAWMRKNITGPIRELEESARNFAAGSHQLKENAQLMAYEPPDIRTENEVQSLSEAITKMSDDMQEYVHGILNAENRAEHAEQEAETMTILALQDALTHVKSKAAYDQMMEDLSRAIDNGEKPVFGIVMIDLNDLKKINDNYGHEKGDQYLIGSCMQICEVFSHSPVFRIGGDEFVVLLQGRDYENRAAMNVALNRAFTDSRTDMDREPWERYSAAAGMAVYTGAPGETAEMVFQTADERMYEDKQHMKAQGYI